MPIISKLFFSWHNELFIKENILDENSLVIQEVCDKLIELFPFAEMEIGIDQLENGIKQILAQYELQDVQLDVSKKYDIMVNFNFKLVLFLIGILIARLVDKNIRLALC